MDHSDWLKSANAEVINAVADCFRKERIGGWSENHITTQVLYALEKVGTELAWSNQAQHVRWEGYKLTGSQETDFGDIALLVRVWLTADEHIDGVAYYEAKRQYFSDSGAPIGFKSINHAQLNRIGSNTHVADLLLYDVDHSTNQVGVSAVPMKFVEELAKGTPARSVLAHSSGRTLHHYGLPWIRKLGNNFRGFELDFSPTSVAAIRSLAESTHAPYALLNVAVGMVNISEPQLDSYCETLANYQRAWGVAPPDQTNVQSEVESPKDDYPHP